MKRVHPTRQVIHLWAHQTQSDARNAAGNVFFEGPTLYSYGRHFPMARIHKSRKGTLVLLNSGRYSATTGKHQGWVSGAARHLSQIHVPEVNPLGKADHDSNLVYLAGIAAGSLKTAQRAMQSRTVEWRMREAVSALADWGSYARFFGIRRKVPDSQRAAWVAALNRVKAIETPDLVRDAKRFKAKAARETATLARFEAEREAWRTREKNQSLTIYHFTRAERAQWRRLPCMLRVNGDQIETSQGARIPLDHAPRLWALIRRAMSGHPYQANGHSEHAGEFKVDSVSADGTLKAGCHTILWPELERLARTLDLA